MYNPHKLIFIKNDLYFVRENNVQLMFKCWFDPQAVQLFYIINNIPIPYKITKSFICNDEYILKFYERRFKKIV